MAITDGTAVFELYQSTNYGRSLDLTGKGGRITVEFSNVGDSAASTKFVQAAIAAALAAKGL